MRIGIDARFLTHPQDGGFKTYTENIVYGLASLDQGNEYILYTDRPGLKEDYLGDNFRVVPVGGFAPIREQILLPIAMRRDRIDIAHFPCNTASFKMPCKMVLTIHDLIPCMSGQWRPRNKGFKSCVLGLYWRKVMPLAARRADRIITISESSKNDIIKLFGVNKEKIDVVSNGVHSDFRPLDDPEELRLVQTLYGLPERFILGFVSSDPRKNCERLVRAAGIAATKLNDVGLVLICASDEAKKMASDIISKYISPFLRVVLLDPVTKHDLIAIYSLAEVLAFPSLYEGFGLPIIEAMACRTPVVTSNVSSLPEVAGDAAVFVDPTDTDAIADALIKVATNTVLQAQMISRGVKRAADFSWQHSAQQIINVYKSVYDRWRLPDHHLKTETRISESG